MTMSKSKLPKRADKIPATQKVESYLKQAVYEGRLKPRERIIEDDVARHLGVSRGTVREALLRLERDGLVVTTSRRGTYIRDISPEETGVVFGIRGKLEGLCVRYMREAVTPQTKTVLHDALRKIKKAATAHDDEQFFYADMEFHRAIWKLSGQPQLFRTLNLVMNPFIFMIARTYSSRLPIAERFQNHKEYLDMIFKTPPDRVEQKVERYFERLHRQSFPLGRRTFHSPDEHSWLGSPLVDRLRG